MKILILKPQKICYGIMETIANNFGNALSRAGAEIIYFDIKQEPVENLINYVKETYQAVIDIYSGLLGVRAGEEYFWNCVNAPVFQICVDFPVYVMEKMEAKLHRYYALCLDRHYCDVIGECMPNIRDAYFFPMAGIEGTKKIAWEQRSHNLVFVGSYSNYREWLVELEKCEEGIKSIGYAFFNTMCNHTELDQKQAFAMALAGMNIELEKEEFYKWMKMIGGIAMSAVAYQRERVVETLLQAGLEVEVFGNSWKDSPLAHYSNLLICEQVDETEYISVLEDAKVSLNIMYCNKAGYSERYSYSMLNGAVCVSDVSEYLCEEFMDGTDIVFYQLDRIEELPDKVKWLLEHPEDAGRIADAAYEKAKREHTWEERTERFLRIAQRQIEEK